VLSHEHFLQFLEPGLGRIRKSAETGGKTQKEALQAFLAFFPRNVPLLDALLLTYEIEPNSACYWRNVLAYIFFESFSPGKRMKPILLLSPEHLSCSLEEKITGLGTVDRVMEMIEGKITDPPGSCPSLDPPTPENSYIVFRNYNQGALFFFLWLSQRRLIPPHQWDAVVSQFLVNDYHNVLMWCSFFALSQLPVIMKTEVKGEKPSEEEGWEDLPEEKTVVQKFVRHVTDGSRGKVFTIDVDTTVVFSLELLTTTCKQAQQKDTVRSWLDKMATDPSTTLNATNMKKLATEALATCA
jgi:hypothetical protein